MPSLGTVTFTPHPDNQESDSTYHDMTWTENPSGVASMSIWIRPDSSAHQWYFEGTASPSELYELIVGHRPDPNKTSTVELKHSTVYHVQVRGANADGDVDREYVGSFRTQPEAPRYITTTLPGSTAQRHKQVQLSWGNTIRSDLSHFELRVNGGRFGALSTGNANLRYIASEFPGTRIGRDIRSTGHTVTGLQANTQYRFAVRAWDKHGNASFYQVAFDPIRTAPLPLHPPSVAVTDVDHDSATLVWTQGLYVVDAGWPTTFDIHPGSGCKNDDILWEVDAAGRNTNQSYPAVRENPNTHTTTTELVPSTRYTFSIKANYAPENHPATSVCSNTVTFNTRIGFTREFQASSSIGPDPNDPNAEVLNQSQGGIYILGALRNGTLASRWYSCPAIVGRSCRAAEHAGNVHLTLALV